MANSDKKTDKARELFSRTEKYAENVRKRFASAVDELLKISKGAELGEDGLFSFSANKATSEKANEVIRMLYKSVYSDIKGGIVAEWAEANLESDKLIKTLFGELSKDKRFEKWFDRNLQGLEGFFARQTAHGGLNLSQKVWKYAGNLKTETELALSVSLSLGDSASKVSKNVRHLLQEPDKLFRKVRTATDKNGKPIYRLSKAAKAYHPGQGVYRSSYKNAMRLARTETNMAYRNADFERWQKLPFVKGVEIRLSNNHNCEGVPKGRFFDICDELAGVYPKTFKFTGWHPQCRCFAVPVIADEREIEAMEDAILEGRDVVEPPGMVSEPPKAFADWLKDNEERIKSANILPWWIQDNKAFLAPKKPFVPLVQKEHGYVDGMSEAEKIAKIGRETNTDEKTARAYYDAVHGFSGADYITIRKYQTQGTIADIYKERAMKLSKDIEEFLSVAPQWDGGSTYRGMAMTKYELDRFVSTLRQGKGSMGGTASWTTEKAVAKTFADENLGSDFGLNKDQRVIVIARKQKNATSIMQYSRFASEKEVLSSASNRWELVKITEKADKKTGITDVTIEVRISTKG